MRRLESSKSVRIDIALLENKARELNIFDLRSFYTSNLFRSHGFSVDHAAKLIVKEY
jgi:hypothetical protein